ncbi:DUF3304 domain-containing protein [Janthinobacterium sp. FW305-128]|uniref:DUF3304 domain-containing protein n=1 Tax=Janthinobacterium sp. FW305-128 TaxID=2775055 RepID=UPI001E5CCDB3|nr:DUF3304 domain-containing protein [Janthinobacterium sp. FW305-128]MCC7683505.1 DUF3304 domain-containing protein [Janthinobacterium sp. FW305-128]
MKISVSLTAYNHTEHRVESYTVTLQDGSSAEAGYLDPGEGRGGKTCYLSIPSVWKPGMKVTIVMNAIKNGKAIRVEKTVPVPQYSRADVSMLVHDGSYKVFVTKYSFGHRKYPLSDKEAELEPGVPLEIIWE